MYNSNVLSPLPLVQCIHFFVLANVGLNGKKQKTSEVFSASIIETSGGEMNILRASATASGAKQKKTRDK